MSQNTPKAERKPIPVSLEDLAAIPGTTAIYAKVCNFDHTGIPCVAHAILSTSKDGTQVTKRTLTTYSGCCTQVQLDRFHSQPGRVLAIAVAVQKELKALEKANFKLVTPEPKAPEPAQPKRRGGRKAAGK